MKTHSEISLIAVLRAMHEQAFGHFAQRYDSRVFAVSHRFRGTPAWDSFLSAFRSIDSLEGQVQFSTWLHRVASNAGLMKRGTQRLKREEPRETRLSHYARRSAGTANGGGMKTRFTMVWTRLTSRCSIKRSLCYRIVRFLVWPKRPFVLVPGQRPSNYVWTAPEERYEHF